MSLPKSLNATVTRAQINHPVLAGKVIRRLTGSTAGKKGGATASTPAEHAPHVSGVAAAKTAAGVPGTPTALSRDNGIEAAKIAAGVPAAH